MIKYIWNVLLGPSGWKSLTLKWQYSVSTAGRRRYSIFFKVTFPDLEICEGLKSVTSDQTVLSISLCYCLRQTHTFVVSQSSCVSWKDYNREERRTNQVVHAFKLLHLSGAPPQVIHVPQFRHSSLKLWWRVCRLIHSTPIIFLTNYELFMFTSDAMTTRTRGA